MNNTILHPDHLRLLALAKASFAARDNRSSWQRNTMAAAKEHGYRCDALWAELEKQVCESDGAIPTLEHPSETRRKMIANLRSEIVMTAQNAMVEALNELADGPIIEDED